MLASPADWISPGSRDGFRDDPPAWDGKKVSLLDTDHVWGIGGNGAWVWKAFLRGHNPLFMDPYDGEVIGKRFDPQWEPVRRNMGIARRLAERIDLAAMTPSESAASSKYCLANPGQEYVAYKPAGIAKLSLTFPAGSYDETWIDSATGEDSAVNPVEHTGGNRMFPSPKDALLHLRRRE